MVFNTVSPNRPAGGTVSGPGYGRPAIPDYDSPAPPPPPPGAQSYYNEAPPPPPPRGGYGGYA